MAGPGSRDDDFTAFVLARSARLVHFARMLCGDAELAEDLVQTALENAYLRGSIRRPAAIAKPAPDDAEAFAVAVANNLISVKGKQYEYYWAAGQLPSGVASIAYTFPDGQTTKAVITGNYWVMQHQTATPWKEGSPQGAQIQVALYLANGQPTRSFLLNWGQDNCAQISHGC